MFVHIWRMKGRKKRGEEYEKFGRQVTLPALKKIDGCLDAHFVKVFEARKPEYLWLVFWRNKEALEAARTNSSWRDQIKRFEAGKFYKTIPLELVCESLGSFGRVSVDKSKKAVEAGKSGKGGKAGKSETSGNTEAADRAEIQSEEGSSKAFTPPTAEGE
jgi:heme-degrading monooxygenase HmoA